MSSFWAGFQALVMRDLILSLRSGGGAFLALVFFALIALVVPIGLGPDLPLLSQVAPAMAWVAAALATQITLDRLFQADHEDGGLDGLVLSPLPLEAAVLAKCTAHWLTTGLPLALAAPVFGLLFAMDPGRSVPLLIALLIGTPALTFVGAVGAALTVSLRRGGVLVSLLVLPLYVPVLIFGAASVADLSAGEVLMPPSVLILAALTLITGVIAAWAGAAALRLNAD